MYMIEDLFPLFSVALGSFISIFVTFLTNKNSLKQMNKTFEKNELIRKRQLLQQKGEELYKAIYDWKSLEKKYHSNYIKLLEEKNDHIAFNASNIGIDRKELKNQIKSYSFLVKMHIQIYFPDLILSYKNIEEETDMIEAYISDNSEKKRDDRAPMNELYKARDSFDKLIDLLHEKLAEKIRL